MPASIWFQPEFHDVTVDNFPSVASYLAMLSTVGLPCWHLMVVPDTEGAGAERALEFAAQLHKWQSHGHKLHLHGFRHHANLTQTRSWSGRLALRLTNGEAEFAGLDYHASNHLLQCALEAWYKLDLGTPNGFVPPTWFGNAYLLKQCQANGLSSYGSRWFIWQNQMGTLFSPAFSCAGLPSWAQILVRRAGQIYAHIRWGRPRVVLHPCDFTPSHLSATLSLIRSLAAKPHI